MPENRWIEYILWNPCYIGKQRWSPDGGRAVCNRDYNSEKIRLWDGNWQPLISIELWDKVHKRLNDQKKAYPKYAKRQQSVNYMLKGLVRCSSCGATLAVNGVSGKAKTRVLQCCRYSRGTCRTSHSIVLPTIEAALVEGLKKALGEKQFTIVPTQPKNSDPTKVDYDKLIAVEERRLARAKEAYLAEIDTIEQYANNKKEITARIDDLKARRDKEIEKTFDVDAFSAKVAGVVDFIQRDDVTPVAKNEALRSIIEMIVFEKAKGNLAIYFHDF
jgi:hypothetical protein